MKKGLLTIFGLLLFGNIAFSQVTGYAVGNTVLDFTVTDTDGNTHNLYNYTSQGKYVMLDFFFAACGPCQSYQPTFNEFYDKYGCNSGDVICLSINSGVDNNQAVINYEATYGGSFNHAPAVSNEGGSSAVDANFAIAAYPTTTLIGPDNAIMELDIWPVSGVGTLEAVFPAGAITPNNCSAVSTNKVKQITNFSIYPNPITDYFTLNFNTVKADDYTIRLYNTIGQMVFTQHLGERSGQIMETVHTSDLEHGQYIVEVVGANGASKQQLIMVFK